jgi:hypothetical protein
MPAVSLYSCRRFVKLSQRPRSTFPTIRAPSPPQRYVARRLRVEPAHTACTATAALVRKAVLCWPGGLGQDVNNLTVAVVSAAAAYCW